MEQLLLDFSAKVVTTELFALYVEIQAVPGGTHRYVPPIQAQVVGKPDVKGNVRLKGEIAAPRVSGTYRARVLLLSPMFQLTPLAEQTIDLTVKPMVRDKAKL